MHPMVTSGALQSGLQCGHPEATEAQGLAPQFLLEVVQVF
jgi:hypothetical protein